MEVQHGHITSLVVCVCSCVGVAHGGMTWCWHGDVLA